MLEDISLPDGFGFRVAQIQDQSLMEALFRSAREYLYLMPIPKQQIDLLMKQQFVLQQTSYAQRFPNASTFIVEFNSESIGKITLNKTDECLHLIDIVLLEKSRTKGYGSTILRALQKLAGQQKRLLQLAVDQQNLGAKKLYFSLGFSVKESSDTHDTMIWLPVYP